ncbi:MAG: SDR family NAD(P)-dependent oxidoreductase, partial [Bacteroidota bacterium]
MLNQFKLDGKTALVTGCKRGIGKAMAIGLAEAGADIIGVSANTSFSTKLPESSRVADTPIMSAPASAKPMAMALPIPLLQPVT